MEWLRIVEILCGTFVSVLSVLKAWLEWDTLKSKHNIETNENGDDRPSHPRS